MEHTIIFSHGFGVRKDARGLFSDIASEFSGSRVIMFDYNDVDEIGNTLTVRPINEQATRFQNMLDSIESKGGTVDVICHSQGSIAVALARPKGIRKVLFLAPPITMNLDRMLKTFGSRPGVEINTDGVSKFPRRDGSVTLVPPQYWVERKNIQPVELYNRLADETKLVILKPNQDEVLENADYSTLSPKIDIISLDGDHNFTGEARQRLLDSVKNLLHVYA